MTELFLIFISACLVNNLLLDYLLGIDPLIGVSRKIETAFGMATAMLVILPLSTIVTYTLDSFVLRPFNLEFSRLAVFVITITLLTLMLGKLIEKFRPELHEKITVFLPLLLVNTALLGVALINIQQDHGLFASLFFAAGAAFGFAIVVIIYCAIHQRIIVADVPRAFRGAPILLITLGMLSMAFLGFTGLG